MILTSQSLSNIFPPKDLVMPLFLCMAPSSSETAFSKILAHSAAFGTPWA